VEVAEEAAGVANFQLTYMALEGSAEGMHDLIDACADGNFRGIDCMKMHIPAYEEHALVVQLLLKRGAARRVGRRGSVGSLSASVQLLFSMYTQLLFHLILSFDSCC
jgi:hypothetical protein